MALSRLPLLPLEPVPADADRPPAALAAAVSLLTGLNREQRRAVTHLTGPALVIAGPGTGKTEVVTRRVAWLIATKHARPREILALTFTDNAAQEMQARVDVLVPYGQADAAIHTFHAFGDRLLREHSFELGLPTDVRLLSRSELIVVLREHLFELGLERYLPLGDPTRFLGALVDFFSRAKDEDVPPEAIADHAAELLGRAEDEMEPDRAALLDLAASRAEIATAFERYGRLLAAGGYIDHSDQIALPLRLLRDHPAVRATLAARYRFIVVDELQDTNRAQLEMVLALAGSSRGLMAVGDPEQGIYGFRGARTGNVARFGSAFDTMTTISLRRNYRSVAAIIASARRLIANNRTDGAEGVGQVAHRRRRGRPVRHVGYATPEAEADGVASEIEHRIRIGARPSEFCVLVRSNTEIDDIVRSLRVRGIPVDSGARARLAEAPAVRSLIAFLRVVANPADSLEMFALAASDPYLLTGAELGMLMNTARRRNRSLWEAINEAADTGNVPLEPLAVTRIVQLIGHVRAGVELSAEHSSGEVLYDYLKRRGRLTRLARASDEGGASEARSVARFCELVRARAALLAHDRVPFLVAQLDVSQPDDERDLDLDETQAVKVLTVHRAKGLEFSTVFICGLVEGRFPVKSRPPTLALPDELLGNSGSDLDGALAEERRLFYVALTRARDEVQLSSYTSGPRGRGRRRPSVFIAETLDLAADEWAAIAADTPPADLANILVAPEPPPPMSRPAGGPLSLSFSQVDEYMTCPERYRLRYDIGIPTPAHHALTYGTAIHQTIAAFHLAQARGTTLTDDELVAELTRNWQAEGYLSREHEDARFAAGRDALLRFRAQQIGSGAPPPVAVERPFTFRLGRDQVRGRIDRIDDAGDGAVITDYKSSDVRDQKRADVKARDSLQLQVYALAYEAETGKLPRRVQLHFVESGVVGSAEPDRDRLDKARQKLVDAASAIRERAFESKPSPITCGFCPFRTICRASAA